MSAIQPPDGTGVQTTPPRQPGESATRQLLRRLIPRPIRATWTDLVAARHRRRLLAGRAYEPDVAKALGRLIRPGDVCADVGANYGLLSAVMARRSGPIGRVYAFEPHPNNVLTLRRTLANSGLINRVIIEAVAVNDGATDSVTLCASRDRHNPQWNIVDRDASSTPTDAEFRVPAVSLDQYFAKARRLDLVKIDVEGAEDLVLDGMRDVLGRLRPSLLVELHSDESWQAWQSVVRRGYAITDLHERPVLGRDSKPPHIIARPM